MRQVCGARRMAVDQVSEGLTPGSAHAEGEGTPSRAAEEGPTLLQAWAERSQSKQLICFPGVSQNMYDWEASSKGREKMTKMFKFTDLF